MLSKVVRKIYGSYIPIIDIHGTINNVMAEKVQHKLQRLSVANCEAIAVLVDSPGGLPVQCQIIGKKIRMFARKNNLKLLTFGGEMVASGGYLILAQGDEVYCDVSSVIGSIGVSIPKYDLKGGLEYLSLEQKKIVSNNNIFGSKLNPFHELNEQETAKINQLCQSMHQKLVQQVRELRKTKLANDQTIFDGTLFTGQQSKNLGLVDGIGSMIQILQSKYPGCRLGIQKKRSFWNTLLKIY